MKLRTWCIRIGQILTKTVLIFTGFLVFLTLFSATTTQAENGRGGITIHHDNAPIQQVFQSIEKQSGYRFFYNETLLQGAGKVTLNLQNVSLQEALEACFRNQPLSYAIVDKTIIVKRRQGQQSTAPIPTAVSFTQPVKGKLIAVRGKVTSNNQPVPGATIMIKGTDNGVSTDKDGIFTLSEVDEDAVLIVSSISHEAREIKVNGQSFISIDLNKKSDDLDDAVVVAYNTTTVKKNIGAVTVVKGEDIQSLPNRSVDKSLQGLVPGLLVTSGTGQPGGGLSNFVLRGIATGQDPTSGSTVRNPLIVVDGMPVTQDNNQWATGLTETPVINPMAQLNPSDIESITVLKDAAAIALYGSKASNGVILITTKKGKAGKTVFNIRHQTDIAKRLPGKVKLLNQQEYLDLLYETFRNSDPVFWTGNRIDSALKSNFPITSDGNLYPETNWENELYTNQATTVSNELSLSGGNDRSKFYINMEYTKQNGVYKKTGYDRKSLRLNFENKPTNWFKIGLNTALSYSIQDYAALYGDFPLGVSTWNTPLNPVRLEDGSYFLNFTYPLQTANPAAANEYNTNRNTSFRGISKFYAELSFLKYFKFTSSVGVDFMLAEAKEKFDPRLYDPSNTVTPGSQAAGRIQERDNRTANLIANNVLRFDKIIKRDHSLNILAGQEAQILTNKNLMATGTGLQVTDYDQINNTSTRSASGSLIKQTLLSWFGQANYTYKNKYLLTSSIRADGSSKFGEHNRFGTYWSVGTGWIATEEQFVKKATPWLNYFKIRGSIGAAGNSFAIDRFTRYDRLTTANYLNNIVVYPGSLSNPDIRWEKTFSWDAGIEARIWKERIAFTADIYKRKTSDLIYNINLPFSAGFSSVLENIGDIENKGVELSLSLDVIRTKNFTWNLNANWSTNKNILVKADVPLSTITGTVLGNQEGRSFNSFYMKKWGGVDPATGAPMWIDSTGKKTTNKAAAKQEFVGKPQPDGFGSVTPGFTYKNIQLSALFYYQYGFQIYNSYLLTNDGSFPYMNQDKRALDRWQKPNDIAANPKRSLDNSSATGASTRFLFNGDFIRLQTITLGYNFPKKVLSRLRINMLKVFVQAYNLKLWTKYPGEDVSNVNAVGSTTFSYPNQRSYSMGLNLNF